MAYRSKINYQTVKRIARNAARGARRRAPKNKMTYWLLGAAAVAGLVYWKRDKVKAMMGMQ